MKITIKTLKNEVHPLEVDAADTVLSMKEKIHEQYKLGEPGSQKLIHAGKILKNAQTVGEVGIAENDFIVIMVTKKKTKKKKKKAAVAVAATSAAATPSAATTTSTVTPPAAATTTTTPTTTTTGATSNESAATTTTTPTTAAATPSADASGASAASGSQGSGDAAPAAQAASGLVVGAEYEAMVAQLMAMGYTKKPRSRFLLSLMIRRNDLFAPPPCAIC
eukprot:TRINITY_DN66614_c8_g5_i2.p2 TRINITY_DN66614_c8_g5~~TRINITY_DN66614_c8_g5_i2.p2  ORF type:complete len:237 (+),score=90.92 TRINITY_DN66614_c8_g5_i2:51-713(+)